MNIKGLGSRVALALVEHSGVKSPADLYSLSTADLSWMGGRKQAGNLINAIAESRNTTLPRLLHALGIPGCGAAAATAMAGKFTTLESIMTAGRGDLLVAGVGDTTATAVFEFFQNQDNIMEVQRLIDVGIGFSNAS